MMQMRVGMFEAKDRKFYVNLIGFTLVQRWLGRTLTFCRMLSENNATKKITGANYVTN
jgi:hypothetical protein